MGARDDALVCDRAWPHGPVDQLSQDTFPSAPRAPSSVRDAAHSRHLNLTEDTPPARFFSPAQPRAARLLRQKAAGEARRTELAVGTRER